jgi:hypothetical protein
MYINQLSVQNLRGFQSLQANFAFDGQSYGPASGMAPPQLPNVNVVLGENGLGKSTVLRAVALAALGPHADLSGNGLPAGAMLRRVPPAGSQARGAPAPAPSASIEAVFSEPTAPTTPSTRGQVYSALRIVRTAQSGEQVQWVAQPGAARGAAPGPAQTAMAFAVGYGSSRRPASPTPAPAARGAPRSLQAQRFASLLDDDATLVPLESWLPALRQSRARFDEVTALLAQLLALTPYRFSARRDRTGHYLFEDQAGLALPLYQLSGGTRAFIGWVADLLHHLEASCPRGTPLKLQPGMVLIDEIDLHLHPAAQLRLVPVLAAALPRVQFVLSTHSPLVVGGLDIANILVLRRAGQGVEAVRVERPVYGLDADQLLVSELFGLPSSRTPSQRDQLRALAAEARTGDPRAALRFLDAMAGGRR